MFNVFGLVKTVHVFTMIRKSNPGLLVFLGFTTFFLFMSYLFIWQIYQKVKIVVETHEDSPMLMLSYLAYRLYICVLGVAFMLLSVADFMHV